MGILLTMIILNAEKREIFGKKLKKSRGEGKMPAIVYGRKKEATPVFLDLKDFSKTWKEAGKSTVLKLKNPDNHFEENVIIQQVDLDPLHDKPLHADFYVVEMDKIITAPVPLVFKGESSAEKDLGGVLVKVVYEVEVEALPNDLPKELIIDVSGLDNMDSQIAIKDIKLPKGVKINAEPDEVVALISEAQGEIIEEPTMTIADVEVEKKGKKEEEVVEEK